MMNEKARSPRMQPILPAAIRNIKDMRHGRYYMRLNMSHVLLNQEPVLTGCVILAALDIQILGRVKDAEYVVFVLLLSRWVSYSLDLLQIEL